MIKSTGSMKSAPTIQHASLASPTPADPWGLSLARILFVATLWAAPWAFGAVQREAWAALSVLTLLQLFLWAIGMVQRGAVRIVWSPLYLPGVLFLLLGLVQFSAHLTLDRAGTREALLKLVTDLIIFFLAGQLYANAPDKTWRASVWLVVLLAFMLSVFAILQFLSGVDRIYWQVKAPAGAWPFGPYVNHNHYAGLMEMLVPIGLAYVLSRRASASLGRWLGLAIIVALASLLLSASRGGLVALLVEVAVLGGVLWRPGAQLGVQRLAATAVIGFMAVAALFIWVDPGYISKRLEIVVEVGGPAEAAFSDRKAVALDSLRMFRAHPWVGTGLGSFVAAYPVYQSFPSDLSWDHAHDDYAEALAETGLAGAVLIAGSLVLFFRLAFADLRRRLQHERGWIQFGAAVGCCGLLVHSFVDFNLHLPANAAWFAACAGLGTLAVDMPAVRSRTVSS